MVMTWSKNLSCCCLDTLMPYNASLVTFSPSCTAISSAPRPFRTPARLTVPSSKLLSIQQV